MKLIDMITDKVTDAIAIGMQAKETIEEEKNKRTEKKREKEEQEEAQKRLEAERLKQEAALKRKKTLKWAIPAACAFFIVTGAMAAFGEDAPKEPAQEPTHIENTASNQAIPSTTIDGELKVTYLDVGQGDSIFIELPNDESMLIDAGNSSDGSEVVSYIKSEGYSKIDYLVATHPHSDHIGGMTQVVESLDIGSIFMPKVSHTTNDFESLLDAIDNKSLTIKTAKAGVNILDDRNLSVEILAPVNDSYSDLNNYSVVIKIVYGYNSFLFMGDAEKFSEGQITADVAADVLKVGHHGSDYSSGLSFLNLVSPDYSIISVGEGNQYGHPSSETINTLFSMDSKVYRTDLDGTIVFVSDGIHITVSKSPVTTTAVVVDPTEQTTTPSKEATTPAKHETTSTQSNNNKITVYKTDTGEKYHNDGCRYLSKSKIAITLQQAKDEGLTPCSICHPPQ